MIFIGLCLNSLSQTCNALYSYGGNFENVQFTNQSSVSNAHYYWNFGDGTGSNIENPIHEFVENGKYLVTLFAYDTVSKCSDYYEQWINVTKYSLDPCSPTISDSIYSYNYFGFTAYYLKIIDNSTNCINYSPTYKVGESSGPYSNTFGIGLYPANFISTAYYRDNSNVLKRSGSKTSPNNYNRSKNYQDCSANFEMSVVSEDAVSQRILFKAMNKDAYSYKWLITGFGDPIISSYDTISILYGGNPYSQFPDLGNIVVLTVGEQNGCRDSLLQQIVVRKKAATFVGIEQNTVITLNVNLFPNPSRDRVSLNFDQNYVRLDKLFIYNNLGQTVFIMDNPSEKQEIDISFLSQGIYFLNVSGKSGTKVFKIIKE